MYVKKVYNTQSKMIISSWSMRCEVSGIVQLLVTIYKFFLHKLQSKMPSSKKIYL
jgi:hypothetical protein